jgi:hypothetical protein
VALGICTATSMRRAPHLAHILKKSTMIRNTNLTPASDQSLPMSFSYSLKVKSVLPVAMVHLFPLSCTCLAITRAIAAGLLASTISTSNLVDNPSLSSTGATVAPIPVLEIIVIYGKLAGSQCYGKLAPKDSSCQVTLKDVYADFGISPGNDNASSALTRDEFRTRLNDLEFQWPLKPYGVEKSNDKTATMNKGAETRVFMEELEQRGFYDRRNPTGPLPTSLRPQLNQALQNEGVNSEASDRVFDALVWGGEMNSKLSVVQIEKIFGNGMDYYGFLDLIGKESVVWPY